MTTAGGSGPEILPDLWPALAEGATVHLFGGFLPDAVIRTPDGVNVPSQPIRSQAVRHPVALPGGRTGTLVGSRGASRDDFDEARWACLPDIGGTLDLARLSVAVREIRNLIHSSGTPQPTAQPAAQPAAQS